MTGKGWIPVFTGMTNLELFKGLRISVEYLEVIEIVGIGKREKEKVYKLIYKQLKGF